MVVTFQGKVIGSSVTSPYSSSSSSTTSSSQTSSGSTSTSPSAATTQTSVQPTQYVGSQSTYTLANEPGVVRNTTTGDIVSINGQAPAPSPVIYTGSGVYVPTAAGARPATSAEIQSSYQGQLAADELKAGRLSLSQVQGLPQSTQQSMGMYLPSTETPSPINPNYNAATPKRTFEDKVSSIFGDSTKQNGVERVMGKIAPEVIQVQSKSVSTMEGYNLVKGEDGKYYKQDISGVVDTSKPYTLKEAKSLGTAASTARISSAASASQAIVTPVDIMLYGSLAKTGLQVGAGAFNYVAAKSSFALPNLFSQGIGQAGRINVANMGFGGIYQTSGQVLKSGIVSVGEKIVSSQGQKEILKLVGTQVYAAGAYYVAPQLPEAARQGQIYQNVYYKGADEETIKAVQAGYARGNVDLLGGTETYEEEGTTKSRYSAPKITNENPVVSAIEGFAYGQFPAAKTWDLGETGFFGTGLFSTQKSGQIKGALEEQIKTTKGYQTSANKEQYLKEAIQTEFYAAQLGSGAGQFLVETGSEIGLSGQARIAIPFFGRYVSPRKSVMLGLATTTPLFGGAEAVSTTKTQLAAERRELAPEQYAPIAVQGAVMATAINTAIGYGLPSTIKPTGLTAKQITAAAKNAPAYGKVAYYGAKAAGYGFDTPELLADIGISPVKRMFGLNVGVPTFGLLGIGTTSTSVVSATKSSSQDMTGETPRLPKGLSNTYLPTKQGTDTGIPITNDIIDVTGKTNTGIPIFNQVQNQGDTTVNNIINTSSSTNTSTTTSIPTIVTPYTPFIPFMPFGNDSPAYGGSRGSTRKKYYNELQAAFVGLGDLDTMNWGRKKKKRKVKKK